MVDAQEAQALAGLVRALNSSGHNPATSGNYSLRSADHQGMALVSESGVDKSLFTENNFLLVDIQTGQLEKSFKEAGRKSSDETAMHLAVYRGTRAGCVLHSHLLEGLLFADMFPDQDVIRVQGLELLKGFKGVKTHEIAIDIPCFDNTQDIDGLAPHVQEAISKEHVYGFILRGHGLYAWGSTVKEAKRHLEVFEYIFKYYVYSQRK